jgi:thiol-disulfide isomerase/thioredoxin
MLFCISPGTWSFRAFVEDTVINLTIDTSGAQHYSYGAKKWALIWEIEQTGSKLYDVYKKYKSETKIIYYASFLSALRGSLDAVKDAPDTAAAIQQQIDSVKAMSLAAQRSWIEDYIRKFPSDIAGVFIFYDYYSTSRDISLTYLKAILNEFSGLAKASIYYQRLVHEAANREHLQVDSIAPDFTLLKSDKSTFELSTMRGTYTVLDFWASWCAPCRENIPALKALYTKFHLRGLNIVGVSGDRDWNAWIQALNREQMPWMQVIDEFPKSDGPSRIGILYGLQSLPTYVLLDKEGKVLISTGSKETLTKKIEKVLQ